MFTKLKELIKKTPLFPILRPIADKLKGSPATDAYKRETLRSYGEKYNLSCFVETGTYLGGTVDAMKSFFSEIYSIELDKKLAEAAKIKFKDFPYIKIIEGDSATVLPNLLSNIKKPTLFWLDGHYSAGFTAKGSKETPIIEELNCIFSQSNKNWAVLIDDARCFNGKHDYPTLKSLKKYVVEKVPGSQIKVKNDIIRITP